MSLTNILLCVRSEELRMTVEYGIPLREFAKGKSQIEVAELLGVTQGAVSQMMLGERDIRVVRDSEGKHSGIEIRRIGSRRKPLAA